MSSLESMRRISLNPDEVDLEDTTYLIPHYGELEPLVRSVKAVGVINKPLVRELPGNRLVPVLGRRRLAAASILGLTSMDARMAPPDLSERAGYRLAFWDNCVHRLLGKAAAAVVVKRLIELFPMQTVAEEFLPVLGIPPRGPRLAALQKVGSLEPMILKAFAASRIQERTAVLLAEMDGKSRNAVFDVISRLETNANKSAEIVSNLYDLSVLRGQSVPELLMDDSISTLMDDDEMSGPEKAQGIRDLLRSWKFPELVDQEREFIAWKKALPLPTGVEVRPVEAFESDECYVEIRVRSREEAERLVHVLPAESPQSP